MIRIVAVTNLISLMLSLSTAPTICHAKSPSKYPYGLLTLGYNIVIEDDLAYDAHERIMGPDDPETALSGLYWQCFPMEKVRTKFDSWNGPDGMGPWNKNYNMCTLEISVRDQKSVQIYVDHRGHRIDFCREFIREWKRLTRKQKIVCLNGEGGGYETDKKLGKYKLWTWEKFKTLDGCYSYFADECNTDGCAKGKGLCNDKKL